MPHVRLVGPCKVRSYWDSFEPKVRREGDLILKTIQAYLAPDDLAVVVECTVVEGYLRQQFLAHLIQKDDGALVRLFHASAPEKTVGVRHCLGWIASQVLEMNETCRWASDNLGLDSHSFKSG